ncbi:ABC transporter substrate-binding protein [Conexibacter sp. SYSU D00693]|uniref:ABC transporter substrate-binding protein n=1 Tax=Conexibacter sp. SYSU D00693 TaxID=2812560 RepID=UPI00196B7A54|nr:ABC transporter substrate-binding protein [Conexibacter sp. SYSU D00693]
MRTVLSRRRLAAAAAALLAAGGLAACGGADDDEGGGGGGTASSGEPGKVAGFDGTTIRVGVLTPLTGPVAVIGKPLTAGNEVFFDAVNAKGGIAGKYKVELVQEDTQYRTDLTVQKYNKLKSDVVTVGQVLGTANTLAIVPQLRRDGLIAAPASLDGLWVREETLLPIGGPYQVQAINALDHYVNEGGGKGKKVCSFTQDDAYGEAGQQGLEFGAEKLGVSLGTNQKFKVGDKDVTGQVQRLRSAGCDMVFLVATPTDAGTIWGTAAKLGFAPRWVGQSPAWIDELGASPLKDYLEKTVWIVAEGTEWGDTKVPGMAKMVDDVKRYKPSQQPDYYFAFGYNQARAVAGVLEKAVQSGDLSHDGIKQALEGLGTFSFDGLTGDYQYGPAADREPPRSSTIFEVDPDKPFGLGTLKYNAESPHAKEFTFEKADL